MAVTSYVRQEVADWYLTLTQVTFCNLPNTVPSRCRRNAHSCRHRPSTLTRDLLDRAAALPLGHAYVGGL